MDNHSPAHMRYGNHFLSREASSFLLGSGPTTLCNTGFSVPYRNPHKRNGRAFSHGAAGCLLCVNWSELKPGGDCQRDGTDVISLQVRSDTPNKNKNEVFDCLISNLNIPLFRAVPSKAHIFRGNLLLSPQLVIVCFRALRTRGVEAVTVFFSVGISTVFRGCPGVDVLLPLRIITISRSWEGEMECENENGKSPTIVYHRPRPFYRSGWIVNFYCVIVFFCWEWKHSKGRFSCI